MAEASSIFTDLFDTIEEEDAGAAALPRAAPAIMIDLVGPLTLAEHAKQLCQHNQNRAYWGFEAPSPGVGVAPYSTTTTGLLRLSWSPWRWVQARQAQFVLVRRVRFSSLSVATTGRSAYGGSLRLGPSSSRGLLPILRLGAPWVCVWGWTTCQPSAQPSWRHWRGSSSVSPLTTRWLGTWAARSRSDTRDGFRPAFRRGCLRWIRVGGWMPRVAPYRGCSTSLVTQSPRTRRRGSPPLQGP
jgi:hypothetical protein